MERSNRKKREKFGRKDLFSCTSNVQNIFSRKIFLKIYVVLLTTSGSAKRVKLHYIKNTTRSKIVIKFLLILLIDRDNNYSLINLQK